VFNNTFLTGLDIGFLAFYGLWYELPWMTY